MKALERADIIQKVRSLADLANSSFISDAEILDFANRAFKDLYNKIIEANEDFFTVGLKVKLLRDKSYLPEDFYKMRSLDKDFGGTFYTIPPANFRERENYQLAATLFHPYQIGGYADNYRYTIVRNILQIETRFLLGDFMLWYIPVAKDIGDGASLPVGWENYVIYQAAKECALKEESPHTRFAVAAKEALKVVVKACAERNLSQTSAIVDVESDFAISLGDFGAAGALTGDAELILLPALSDRCELLPLVQEYEPLGDNYIEVNKDFAVMGFGAAPGIRGPRGSWILAVLFRRSGVLYISQELNQSYTSIEQVMAAIRGGPTRFFVDEEIYNNNESSFSSGCLFYSNPATYLVDLENPQEPPLSDAKPVVAPPPSVPDSGGGPGTGPVTPPVTQDVSVWIGWLDDVFTAENIDTVDYESFASTLNTMNPRNMVVPPRTENGYIAVVIDEDKIISSLILDMFEQVQAFTLVGKSGNRSYYLSNRMILPSVAGGEIMVGYR